MSTPTRRDRLREATRTEIKTHARRQMAELGTASISLRGIARDMGLTATALYRYFGSHDDLITELIVDGYNAQADALEAADAHLPHEAHAQRLLTVMLVYREWALEHRTDFQLLYGNPIPGYTAPGEITTPAAARNMAVIIKIIYEAMEAGKLVLTPPHDHIPPTIQQHLENSRWYGVPPILMYIGTIGWARIHGMIMLELFDHTPPVIGDTTALYRQEVINLMQSVGLYLPPD
jgi:AcrR family transcriptional regulator